MKKNVRPIRFYYNIYHCIFRYLKKRKKIHDYEHNMNQTRYLEKRPIR